MARVSVKLSLIFSYYSVSSTVTHFRGNISNCTLIVEFLYKQSMFISFELKYGPLNIFPELAFLVIFACFGKLEVALNRFQ